MEHPVKVCWNDVVTQSWWAIHTNGLYYPAVWAVIIVTVDGVVTECTSVDEANRCVEVIQDHGPCSGLEPCPTKMVWGDVKVTWEFRPEDIGVRGGFTPRTQGPSQIGPVLLGNTEPADMLYLGGKGGGKTEVGEAWAAKAEAEGLNVLHVRPEPEPPELNVADVPCVADGDRIFGGPEMYPTTPCPPPSPDDPTDAVREWHPLFGWSWRLNEPRVRSKPAPEPIYGRHYVPQTVKGTLVSWQEPTSWPTNPAISTPEQAHERLTRQTAVCVRCRREMRRTDLKMFVGELRTVFHCTGDEEHHCADIFRERCPNGHDVFWPEAGAWYSGLDALKGKMLPWSEEQG